MATDDKASSSYVATLDELNRVIVELTVTAVCGREFVRVGKLKEWLSSPGPPAEYGSQRKQIDLLAHAAYAHSLENSIHPPIHESTLLRTCPLTFCILVKLGHGHLIESFQRQHLDDSNLNTMESSTLQAKIESIASDPNLNNKYSPNEALSLARKFDELRWKFFVPTFELHQGDVFSKNHILPIVKKRPMNPKGGTAKLYRIEVLEEFVGTSLRDAVSSSVHDKKDEFGKVTRRYFFALKSFDERNEHRFANEKKAFIGFQHNGMVRYLANFDRYEKLNESNAQEEKPEHDKTYNILLECGECDLDEYFLRNEPPLSTSHIIEFWQDLFEVAETVKGIHKIQDHQNIYRGWHADIKPDNILLVQGKFKLADPGFMKFVSQRLNSAEEAEKVIIEGGTRTYGAPEMYSRTKFPVSQTIDIWSLGCVFSIAATWVVTGRKGMAWFFKSRSQAVKQLGLRSGATCKNQGDQFHDGEKPLEIVKEWHKVLRGFVRDSDYITKQVLEIIEGHMLVTDPDHRDKAEKLCERLQKLLKDTQEVSSPAEFPQSIMNAMETPDNDGPTKSKSIEASIDTLMEQRRQPISSDDREDLTSQVLNLVAMSNSRRSTFKRGPHENLEGKGSSLAAVAESNRESRSINGVKEVAERRKRSGESPNLSIIPNVQKKPHSHNRLNIYDAQLALDSGSPGIFRKLFHHGIRADKYLSDHYENRDIIFLADNSESMTPLWSQATLVLCTLFQLMSLQRDVGMRLCFTFGKPPKVDKIKTDTDVKKLMISDDVKPCPYRRTDIVKSLGEIFDERIQRLKGPWSPQQRLLTLIVLTDGVWEGTKNNGEVKDSIANFVREVAKLQGPHRKRPVSIQFIQFGRDFEAMLFLQHLDNRLAAEKGIPDVIDWEPGNGDVYNMLLGSFVEDIDSREPAEVVIMS